MGTWISKVSKVLEEWGTTHSHIVMLGLDGVGKTTVLYKLKLNETITTIPTNSFNMEEVNVKGLCLSVWDVGGQARIRSFWRQYYDNTDALIFVFDSNDRERLMEAAHELYHTLADPEMHGVPVLVFANKQDLPNSISPSKLAKKLRLKDLQHRNKWHVQGSNAISGDGLHEGLEIVAKMCREHREATGR